MSVLPVRAVTLNLLTLEAPNTVTSPVTPSVLDSVEPPVTASVLDSAVAPSTPSVPLMLVSPVNAVTVNIRPLLGPTLRFPTTPSVPFVRVLPESPATVSLPELMSRDPSAAITVNVRPELGPNSTFPSTPSAPFDRVLPEPPSTLNLSVSIAREPSLAVTLNLLFTVTSPCTSRVLSSVVARVTSSVLWSSVASVTSSVPLMSVLPLAPATLNLFVAIASDPSAAVTSNVRLATGPTSKLPFTAVSPVVPATVNAPEPTSTFPETSTLLFESVMMSSCAATPILLSVKRTNSTPTKPFVLAILRLPLSAVCVRAASVSVSSTSSDTSRMPPTLTSLLPSVSRSSSPLIPILFEVKRTLSTSTKLLLEEMTSFPVPV